VLISECPTGCGFFIEQCYDVSCNKDKKPCAFIDK
jgi:hypothetical protein